jgi:hypothetical protein
LKAPISKSRPNFASRIRGRAQAKKNYLHQSWPAELEEEPKQKKLFAPEL